MSVWITSYLLYGYKFTKKKEIKIIDEHCEELMEEKPYSEMFNNDDSDQILVEDCMCGNYVYIGLKLASIDEDEDDACVNISGNDIQDLKNKLYDHMKSWPDYLINMVKNYEPSLYLFVHAS